MAMSNTSTIIRHNLNGLGKTILKYTTNFVKIKITKIEFKKFNRSDKDNNL